MRTLLAALGLGLSLVSLAACSDSHGRGGDAGTPPGDAACGGPMPFFICVSDCSSDAGAGPICTGGTWACPPGTRELSSCPPTCHGPPPPGCVCGGTEWVCPPMACPAGIDPWDPTDPASACRIEGAHCSSGGDACGAGMFCDCRSGRWNCAVAEPDPVCWCGRQPTAGDRCAEEGASCGECCPTAGGTGWPAMQCIGGHWAPAGCPDLVCPPIDYVCPADTASLVGTACPVPTFICGDSCCGTAVTCTGGVWQPGPDADCACRGTSACGAGSCRSGQYCNQGCGPDDGVEYTCPPLPAECTDCSCIPLWGTQACEMVDGVPHVRELGLCG